MYVTPEKFEQIENCFDKFVEELVEKLLEEQKEDILKRLISPGVGHLSSKEVNDFVESVVYSEFDIVDYIDNLFNSDEYMCDKEILRDKQHELIDFFNNEEIIQKLI
jgi:hypothetical protein